MIKFSIHPIKLFLSLSFLLFTFAAISAMPSDSITERIKTDSIENLDKVVVTASRANRKISETPASMNVISKAAIASSSAKTIEDLLLTQTGVQIRRSVYIGDGIPSDIIIRGIPGALAASRALVLVDGIPTNASGTPVLIVNDLPMEAIERVEIVRGPYSSLYGANAFGGVINIITREGVGKLNGSVNAETSYPFNIFDQYFSKNHSMASSIKNAGSFALWSMNAMASGGTEKFSFVADGGYRTIGNYLQRDEGIVRDSDYVYGIKAKNNGYYDTRFFGKSRYSLTDNSELLFQLRYCKSDLGFGKTKHILPDSADVTIKGERILVGPQFKTTLSNMLRLHAGCYYRHIAGEYRTEYQTLQQWEPAYWQTKTNDWQTEAQAFLNLSKNHTITAGIEFLRISEFFSAMKSSLTDEPLLPSDSAAKAIVNTAGYIQDELNFFDGLNLVPVMRLDYHSEFGTVLSPKLGISYKIADRLRFHSSAGRSFRAPSLVELYLPDFPASLNLNLRANPNLKPEYIWGFDAGMDLSPIKEIIVKIAAFYNSMTDLIGQTVVFTPEAVLTHRNIADAWSKGIEAEIAWNPLKWLSVSVQGTMENSKDELYKVPLDYIPNYLFGFQLALSRTWAGMKFEPQAGFNYVGGRSYLDFDLSQLVSTLDVIKLQPPNPVHLPAYGTLNLSCKLTFPKRIWALIAVQNLLNADYEESPGTLSTGRFATLKIGLDY